MKSLINLLAILALMLITSCSDTEVSETGPVGVFGMIAGLENSDVTAVNLIEIGKTSTDEEGRFSFSFDLVEPEYVLFTAGDVSWYLFVVPGDNIEIHAENSDFTNTFQVSGDRVLENTYLNIDKELALEKNLWNQPVALFREQTGEYRNLTSTGKAELMEKFAVLGDSEDIHPLFLKLEKKYPEYRLALLNSMYPRYHIHLHKISDPDELDFSADQAQEELMQVENTDPDMLKLPVFRELLSSQMYGAFEEYIDEEIYESDASAVFEAEINTINSFFDNSEVAEFKTYDYLKTIILMRGPGPVDQFYNSFVKSTSNQLYIDNLRTEMDKWELIKTGAELPDFEFQSPEGQTVSLSELKGKLVYIDVWATWCGPCIREHPYWEELVAEFEDRPVSFLAVSIDNTPDPWLEMLQSKNLSGIHWYAENAWRSDFAKHFLVQSIPRFILLDKEGKVLEASAARPSGNIAAALEGYLLAAE